MKLFRFFINMNFIISILVVFLQANDEYEKYTECFIRFNFDFHFFADQICEENWD